MAGGFYDEVIVARDSSYVRIIATRKYTETWRDGRKVAPYEAIDRDEVFVRLPERRLGRSEVTPAAVNWTAMGSREPECAAAYAKLIARAARIAQRENADLEASLARSARERTRELARLARWQRESEKAGAR